MLNATMMMFLLSWLLIWLRYTAGHAFFGMPIPPQNPVVASDPPAVSTDIDSLLAFDCKHPDIQVSSVSILSPSVCQIGSIKPPQTDRAYIQLLQTLATYPIEYYSCRIERQFSVSLCAYHNEVAYSHQLPLIEDIMPIQALECRDIIINKVFHEPTGDQHIIFEGLKINATNIINAVIHGSLDANGYCRSWNYWEYKDQKFYKAVVSASYKITLHKGTAAVTAKDNTVHYPGGITCPYGATVECIHPELGYTYTYETTRSCIEKELTPLYTGYVNKTRSTNSSKPIFMAESEDVVFAVEASGTIKRCGRVLHTTPHSSLFIYEAKRGEELFDADIQIRPMDVDISLYINSKMVYFDRHVGRVFTDIYNLFARHQCDVERRTITNLLTLAFLSGSEFAYAYKQVPGYTAELRGEVIHIIRCTPVAVQYRTVTGCYNEIPVMYNNTPMYVTPRNRVLVNVATEVDCSPLMPVKYFLGKNWYTIYPHLSETKNPEQVTVHGVEEFRYQSPRGLVSGGLYSSEVMEEFRTSVMFGQEREALTANIARGYNGHNLYLDQGTVLNLIRPSDYDTLTDTVTGRITTWYGWLVDFGSATFGIMLIYTILVKVFSVFLAGYEIYQRFGFGWRTPCALIPPLSHHMVFRSYNPLVRHPGKRDKANCQSSTVDEEGGSQVLIQGHMSGAGPLYPEIKSQFL
nr:putative glycoprotein [Chuviridae sp.]